MGSGHGGWLSDTFCNGFYGSRQVKLLATRDCTKKNETGLKILY